MSPSRFAEIKEHAHRNQRLPSSMALELVALAEELLAERERLRRPMLLSILRPVREVLS